jgi:peptide/nickel transport system permease protein
MKRTHALGAALLSGLVLAALFAPVLTSHSPLRQFTDYENVPPMHPHLVAADGRVVWPFVRPVKLVDRLERRFEATGEEVPIRWFYGGVLISIDESRGPWFPLGTDPLGRDVLSRLLFGARLSLSVAFVASLGALLAGLAIGGVAGFAGGRLEAVLMAVADFVLVLPAIYVVLALRAAMPLVLSVSQVFWTLSLVLAAAGWPLAARGVRGIIAERGKEYVEAAYSLGASPARIVLRHLLPATVGFLLSIGTIMVPAFVVSEGTLTLVGLGFPVPAASWGAMLRDAWQGGAFTDAPWLMSPAVALAVTTLVMRMLGSGTGPETPAVRVDS